MEMEIPRKDLHPDPNNLRESVDGDTAAFKELVQSIRSVGVLEPLIVRPRDEGGYWIVAGHRRFAAADAAGLSKLDCIVRDISDAEATEMQIIENLMRVDINPVEEASGYFRLVEMGMGRKALAERIGRSTAHIGNRMKLLELPAKVQKCVKRGEINASDAALMLGWEGDDLDELLETARNHADVKWRIERMEEHRAKHDAMAGVLEQAEAATGIAPLMITRGDWVNGPYKAWRDLSEVCSEEQIEKHRTLCPDIHRVLVISGTADWFEATTSMAVTKKELGLTTTISDDDLAEREAKRAEREHKAARLAAMQRAIKGRLPVTPSSLADAVLKRYLQSVHQEVRKTAAVILGLDSDDYPNDQWFPTATLTAMLENATLANKVALALTMAEDAGRFDRIDSLEDELRDWGLLDA